MTKIVEIDPRELHVDWEKNFSRNGEKTDVVDLANDMLTDSKQISPIIVSEIENGYELIVGYRRFEAALYIIENDLDPNFKLECIVRNDVNRAFINIAENLIREDPTPIQTAKALQRLIDDGHTLDELCGRFNRSKGWGEQKLALLVLPEKIQAEVDNGNLPVASALEIAKVGDEEEQIEVFEELSSNGEKVHAEDVKEKRREKGENVKRNLTSIKKFLEKRSSPEELGCNIANLLLDYLDGSIGDDEALQNWDKLTILVSNMYDGGDFDSS